MLIADILEMNKHDKQTIYEAYSIEHAARLTITKELATSTRSLAATRFDRDCYRDAWLALHVEKHVTVQGDMQDALDYYFDNPDRRIFFTPSGGYYCLTREVDSYFIVFAWHNPLQWRNEAKDMWTLINHIVSICELPVRYTGVNNVMKNHSIEIKPGLWELRL